MKKNLLLASAALAVVFASISSHAMKNNEDGKNEGYMSSFYNKLPNASTFNPFNYFGGNVDEKKVEMKTSPKKEMTRLEKAEADIQSYTNEISGFTSAISSYEDLNKKLNNTLMEKKSDEAAKEALRSQIKINDDIIKEAKKNLKYNQTMLLLGKVKHESLVIGEQLDKENAK